MELEEITYARDEYLETTSGNKVHRRAFLPGTHNIVLQGKVIVRNEAIVRADLAKIIIGRNCIIDEKSVIRPPCKRFKDGASFYPLRIGEFTYIGENAVVQAGIVGSYVYIGKNAIIGRGSILKDCCMVEDDAVLPPQTVVNCFSRLGGSPGAEGETLPDCTQDLMINFCKEYYEKFKPQGGLSTQHIIHPTPGRPLLSEKSKKPPKTSEGKRNPKQLF